MKGKKDKKVEEVVDISTLPRLSQITCSLIPNFKNNDRIFKILENIYKNPAKNLKFICRDQIVDYAKENSIFIPSEEQVEINSDQLAKSAIKMIFDKALPQMKDKKDLFDRIAEFENKKTEESSPSKKEERDKITSSKNKDKGKAPVKGKGVVSEPDTPPKYDEKVLELIVLFYNYPLNKDEYNAWDNENEFLNYVFMLNETDDLIVEVVPEVEYDKKGNPIVKKEVKKEKEDPNLLLMQKLFKPVSVFPEEIYQELLIEKNKSAKDSNKRFTFFDNVDFSFYPVDPTRDSTIAFHDDLVSICDFLHSNSLKYRLVRKS